MKLRGDIINMNIPNHIAIIMDGNGRWAGIRGRNRTFGHKRGAAALRKILTHAAEIKLNFLTVFAFSTENWKRADEEVNSLMLLFKTYLKSEERNLMKNNIRFMVTGSTKGVSPSLLVAIRELEEKTKMNTGLVFNVAFNYGGRNEIVDAVNKIIASGEKHVTEDIFRSYLYNDLPDPDLVIRSSGEFRMSNFLLWQAAYSELYVTDTLWPDFDGKDLDMAIEEYNKRDRRYGGTK